MSKHNPADSREACALLDRCERVVDTRQSGSHKTYKFDDGGIVTLSCGHRGEFSPSVRRRVTALLIFYGAIAAGIVFTVFYILQAVTA